jgi:outer membrane receptor protein involved in Fe transport
MRGSGNRSLRMLGVVMSMHLVAQAHAADAPSADLLDLSIEELMQVEVRVASRVTAAGAQQPVSVTTISREDIRASGARTLNELLMLRVPGYFLVEDQDDTIAAVRGLAPDNNSKLMLLLDGRNLNADWFWGPPDVLLNGLDLEFIERIEVIRGPGSVTQGQGALLGVVNLVTRNDHSGHRLALTGGDAGRRGISHGFAHTGNYGRLQLYLGAGDFEGREYRNEGLGRQVEQALSVYERNHRLKRGAYRNLLLRWEQGEHYAALYRFEGERDLYNWRRDRDQVRQVLSGLELGRDWRLGLGTLSLSASTQQDDYALRTTAASRPGAARELIPGLTMGGHREQRTALRAVWFSSDWLEGHRIAVGADYHRYAYGRRNADGNNFLVNQQQDVLSLGRDVLNAQNRWALPGSVSIRSLYFEDLFQLGPTLEAMLAARYDTHPDWGSEWSPRLALLGATSAGTRWRLSWQSGFRGAVGVHYGGGYEGDGLLRESGFDQIEHNPYFRANGNRNLAAVQPEQLRSLELAVQHAVTPELSVDAVAFYNRVRNVIGVGAYFLTDPQARSDAVREQTLIGNDRIGDWGGVFYFQNNAGTLSHRGLEVAVDWRLPAWNLDLRLSHSRVDVLSADPGQFGPGNIYVTGSPADPQSRSYPEQVHRLHLHWRPATFDGRLSAHYNHLYYPSWLPPIQLDASGRSFTPKLDGNLIGNLALQYRPSTWPGLELGLHVKNLFQADALYPATSVAGEGDGNLGVPGVERRSLWATVHYLW